MNCVSPTDYHGIASPSDQGVAAGKRRGRRGVEGRVGWGGGGGGERVRKGWKAGKRVGGKEWLGRKGGWGGGGGGGGGRRA